MAKPKLLRITTVPISLHKLLKGQMRYMSQYYDVVAVSSSGKMLQEVGINEGVRTEAVEMTREITLGKDIRSLWQMYRLMRREKPQIVHTHTPKAGIVGMMAAWLARVPVRLHTIAGLPVMEAEGNKRKLLLWVEKLTYLFATKVYPNSKGLMDFVLENKLTKPEKLKIIAGGSSNGIDTAYFSRSHYAEDKRQTLRSELGIGEDDFVFIFIGRMTSHKGVNELISAFAEVSSSEFKVQSSEFGVLSSEDTRITNPRDEDFDQSTSNYKLKTSNCKLILVGPLEESLDPLLPETLHAMKTNPDIIYVGYQDDVRPYFAISDALAFPSYREGFPNVVMQAGAMDLPSIVSDINGCNEIIIEGENGLIVPAKNADALREAMQYFLDNPEKVKEMAEKSRRMIVDRYEQQAVWESILEEYRKLEITN